MPRLKSSGLALFCGASAALCLPRPGLCFLAWFCLSPLFGLWSRSSGRSAFLTGFLAGFGYHGLALYWVFNTCRFAQVPAFIGVVAWASLAAFLAVNWGLIALAGSWTVEVLPRGARPWAWAAVWTGLAVIWERWTPRLCIDNLGYTQYRNLSLLQMGSVFGPHALGFLIVAFNAALWQAEESLEESAAPSPVNLAALAVLVASGWAWGFYELTVRPMGGPSSHVEILQPAIDQYQKWDEHYERRIMANFDELMSRRRPESPYLVVWPESAIPRWVEEGSDIPEAAKWSRKLGSYQIVGAVSRGNGKNFNSAFLLGADGKFKGAYHKRELVPFGEYVPVEFLKRFVGALNQMGDLDAGEPMQPLMQTPLGPAGASICYEAMFPRWARLDAARGARILVNITNDGWYKDTWGPYQHFQANVFRAIENRVTVIRSGNTGISAVIDPWGVVTARLGLNERGRLDAAVPLEDPFPRRSFYARHGDWFGLLCLFLSLGLAAASLVRPRGSS